MSLAATVTAAPALPARTLATLPWCTSRITCATACLPLLALPFPSSLSPSFLVIVFPPCLSFACLPCPSVLPSPALAILFLALFFHYLLSFLLISLLYSFHLLVVSFLPFRLLPPPIFVSFLMLAFVTVVIPSPSFFCLSLSSLSLVCGLLYSVRLENERGEGRLNLNLGPMREDGGDCLTVLQPAKKKSRAYATGTLAPLSLFSLPFQIHVVDKTSLVSNVGRGSRPSGSRGSRRGNLVGRRRRGCCRLAFVLKCAQCTHCVLASALRTCVRLRRVLPHDWLPHGFSTSVAKPLTSRAACAQATKQTKANSPAVAVRYGTVCCDDLSSWKVLLVLGPSRATAAVAPLQSSPHHTLHIQATRHGRQARHTIQVLRLRLRHSE